MGTERHPPWEVSFLEIDGVSDIDGIISHKCYQGTLSFENSAHELHDVFCREGRWCIIGRKGRRCMMGNTELRMNSASQVSDIIAIFSIILDMNQNKAATVLYAVLFS